MQLLLKKILHQSARKFLSKQTRQTLLMPPCNYILTEKGQKIQEQVLIYFYVMMVQFRQSNYVNSNAKSKQQQQNLIQFWVFGQIYDMIGIELWNCSKQPESHDEIFPYQVNSLIQKKTLFCLFYQLTLKLLFKCLVFKGLVLDISFINGLKYFNQYKL
ncbi:hypothetical protein pb186bvf_013591 [Paramecium bursaria]